MSVDLTPTAELETKSALPPIYILKKSGVFFFAVKRGGIFFISYKLLPCYGTFFFFVYSNASFFLIVKGNYNLSMLT